MRPRSLEEIARRAITSLLIIQAALGLSKIIIIMSESRPLAARDVLQQYGVRKGRRPRKGSPWKIVPTEQLLLIWFGNMRLIGP